MILHQLRSSLADPSEVSSWERVQDVANNDAADKLYEYDVGLEQWEFTPAALLRVLEIDFSVIITGMNVRGREPVAAALAHDMLLRFMRRRSSAATTWDSWGRS